MSTPDPRTEVIAKAERAGMEALNCLYLELHADIVNDVKDKVCDWVKALEDALTTEAARVRGETWREAIQLARFGAMELRDMNEDLRPDWLGYGPAALQDFADQLEEKAKQADHLNDAVKKVSPWSTARPTEPGFYWWRYKDKAEQVETIVKVERGFMYHKEQGGRDVLYCVGYGGLLEDKDGEWCPIARPVEGK